MDRTFLAIGLMSGTSADGVDAALIRTDGQRQIEFLSSATQAYSDATRRQFIHAARNDVDLIDVLQLERQITLLHADAVQGLLDERQIDATAVDLIGFHGHTLRHLPGESLTWQIGNASLLAEKTGIQVVSDFRRRDISAGGQGAPLAPLFHAALVPPSTRHPVCVLNLGGVGNLTWINGDELIAGDTGPGCGLVDQWCAERTGQPFDRDGQLANEGKINEDAVANAMQHPYFNKPFPKSADRFEFSQIDVAELSTADGAATLCAITAESVAQSVRFLPSPPKSWFLTGGGGENPFLVRLLSGRLPNVQSITSIGARPASLEAECFAWLAARHVLGLPCSLPSTTGAQQQTVGGIMTPRNAWQKMDGLKCD